MGGALRHVPVRRARVEVLFQLQKAGAQPNGLQYDPATDRLLVADQGDGALVTVSDPRGARRERVFAAGADRPSGVTAATWQGEPVVFLSSTYARQLTFVRGEEVFAVDCRGVGTGIVDFAADRVGGTHTGYHGLEWDGRRLWAASPPGKAIFCLDLQPDAEGRPALTGCAWFPVAFGNRPHGLAWADGAKRTVWCNDTTLGVLYRYDTATGECLEIATLPEGAPASHGLTAVDGDLWYCEDRTARICRVALD